MDAPHVRRAQSLAGSEEEAVAELAEQLGTDAALAVVFCSPDMDGARVADAVVATFADSAVIGCTTAGQIGLDGYLDHGLVGVAFDRAHFTTATAGLDGLQTFDAAQASRTVQQLLQDLERRCPTADASNTFAFLLIDGMSVREEVVARALQGALGDIPLVGGSAGDGGAFVTTHVLHSGACHTDAAAIALVSTPLPFRVFKAQHFVPTEQRVVVTAADDAHRVVHELDGWPAAEAYARLVGVDVEHLDSARFAATPMVVLIDGANFVRSVQRANPDGSLTFFCAIEEGLVLRVAEGVDLVDNLDETLQGLAGALGELDVVLAMDCILRRLEIDQRGLRAGVEPLLREHRVVGFNSYGEQYRGVHVNQTFTGIAIGHG